MTSRAEDALYVALTSSNDIEIVARQGLPLDVIPTKAMHQVVTWALDRYYESGRTQAPSREALLAVWGEHLSDNGIELAPEDEEIDTVEWALSSLKDTYVHHHMQEWVKDFAVSMAQSEPEKRIETASEHASSLFQVIQDMSDGSSQVRVQEGYLQSVRDFAERKALGNETFGMTLGIPEIDTHLGGIREGELAVFAGGPKLGKSIAMTKFALHEWATLGRNVVMISLENSIRMTMDRLVCLHLGIDPMAWDRGQVGDEKVQWVREFIENEIPTMPGTIHVLRPDEGLRTPAALVRAARNLDAESIYLDQLSFVEDPNPGGRREQKDVIRDKMRSLKLEISGNRDPVPLLVAHQINREGVKAAEKAGRFEMYHLADGSEVERASDLVIAGYQSMDAQIAQMARLMMLASRRSTIKDWEVSWRFGAREVRVLREVPRELV